MTPKIEPPPLGVSLVRIALRLVIIVAFVLAVTQAMDHLMPENAVAVLSGGGMGLGLLVATLAIYALLIALPFVPGVEIGLSLLIFGGAAVAPYVYIATVLGLGLAYLAGRYLSYDWLQRLFTDLRLTSMSSLLIDLKPMTQSERLDRMRQRLPNWAAPVAIRGRYFLLALLLVLPGNAVIGGGGGICLIAGISRLFAGPAALATIALAVMPIPLAVWAFGFDPSRWI